MKTVYLSAGSNLGNREEHLQRAIDLLDSNRLRIIRCSPVYETEPQDLPGQPWFLNLVLEARTDWFPIQLLAQTATVEQRLGRERRVAKGPRTVDIDILLYSRFIIQARELTVPHPRMHLRRFVLQPLADLAPDLRHPLLAKTVRQLLASVEGQTVRRVEFTPVLRAPAPGE
jgi:2-amino-4-hydroxy-6-hydroxymethyldihydropteridine diphosphokinase